MYLFWVGFVIAVLQNVRSDELGCPEPNQVEPCVCTNAGLTYLECRNIEDTETLSNVFTRSSKHRFKEVHIEESVLQYLPADMFRGVQIKELHLKNVTLVELFDDPPENVESLDVLHIEMTNVFRGMNWELLKPMTNLRILTVYYDLIPTIGRDFSEQVTKNLKQLTFYATGTTEIQSGTFLEFTNLEKVVFDACELTEIKRSIFPFPFNVKVLYFNNNKIKTIPQDMFTYMPNLQTLGLRNNQISLLPVTAFDKSMDKLEYLFLENNPLQCDCRIVWLIRNKPPVLTGTCPNLLNANLQEMKVGDIPCFN